MLNQCFPDVDPVTMMAFTVEDQRNTTLSSPIPSNPKSKAHSHYAILNFGLFFFCSPFFSRINGPAINHRVFPPGTRYVPTVMLTSTTYTVTAPAPAPDPLMDY